MEIINDSATRYYQTYLSENMYVEDNGGYLVCIDCVLGRSGSQEYTERELGLSNSSNMVSVYRLEENVFDDDSINSLDGRPFTLYHPKELVNVENYKKYAVGEVFNVHREDNNIIGNIRVFDKKVIDLIVNKKMRELSLGYTNTLVKDEEKGIYKFINILYNHLALVKKGRAGNSMITDSEESEENMEEEKKENEMLKKDVELDNKLAELLPKVLGAVESLEKKIVALEEKVSVMEGIGKGKVVEDCSKDEDKKQVADEAPQAQEEKKVIKVNLANDEEIKIDHDLEMQVYLNKFNRANFDTQKDYEQGIKKLCKTNSMVVDYRKHLLDKQLNK